MINRTYIQSLKQTKKASHYPIYYGSGIRCIHVIEFWRRFRGILSSSAPKCVQKIAFLQTMYLGCAWKWTRSREQNSMPESAYCWFIQRQVYQNVKASYRSLTYLMGCFTDRFAVAKQTAHAIFCPYTYKKLREDNYDAPKLHLKPLATVCSCDRVSLFLSMRLTEFIQDTY